MTPINPFESHIAAPHILKSVDSETRYLYKVCRKAAFPKD